MSHFYPDRDPMLSRPVKVHWAGWESDTLKLQASGWEVSAREDIACRQMELAIRHQGHDMVGLSQRMCFEYFHNDPRYLQALTIPFGMMAKTGTPHIKYHSVMAGEYDKVPFRPVDCMPSYRSMDRIGGIEEFAHFAGARAGQELLVPEEDVNDLLSRILDLQQTAKTQHFLDRVRRSQQGFEQGVDISSVPERKFTAQIISLAERKMAA